jgi:O-antigen ligase
LLPRATFEHEGEDDQRAPSLDTRPQFRFRSTVIEHSAAPSQKVPQAPPPRPVSLVAHLLIFVGAAASVLFAGGPQQASLGAFLLVAGGALVACPPQARVDPRLCLIAGGLVLAASLSFFPHSWLPASPWRQQLIDAGIPLGRHITPVPRETAFWLMIFVATVATALLAQAHPLRSRYQLLVALVAVGLAGAYVTLAFVVQKTGWDIFIDANPRDFGFFLNRNHTASFLATGSLVALGVLAIAVRSERWWHGGAAAAVLVACVTGLLFFGTSRGGLLTLVGGTALWMAGLGREHRTRPMLISMAAIAVAAGVLFVASPGKVRERLFATAGQMKDSATGEDGPASGVPLREARTLIFRDTLKIIRDFPFTGVGLGAFRPVFVYYNEGLPADPPIGHPESDWLMLAAETGVAAVLLLGAGIVLLLRQVWHFRDHAYWPLRWGLLCAALAAVCHGFIDVPAHRAALGWWVLALGSLGAQTLVTGPRQPQRWLHGIFVAVGLVSMGLGGKLLQSDFARGPALPPLEPMWAEGEIIEWRQGGRFADSEAAAWRAIRRSPMYPPLHFHYGVSLLSLTGEREAVDAALRRERLLMPGYPQVTVDQGYFWAELDAGRCVALLREALREQEAIDARWPSRAPRIVYYYDRMLTDTAALPAVQRGLLDAAEGRRALVLLWMRKVSNEVFAAEISRLASDPAIVKGLTPPERRTVIEQWYARGDRPALAAFLSERPEWKTVAAPLEWRQLAEVGKFEEAVRGACGLYRVSLDLPAAGTEPAAAAPDEPEGLVTFRTAWSKGNTVTARRVLEEMRAARPAVPEALRLLAAWAASEGQWGPAWRYLEEHIRSAGLEAPL